MQKEVGWGGVSRMREVGGLVGKSFPKNIFGVRRGPKKNDKKIVPKRKTKIGVNLVRKKRRRRKI
jgi:hypothetical protein